MLKLELLKINVSFSCAQSSAKDHKSAHFLHKMTSFADVAARVFHACGKGNSLLSEYLLSMPKKLLSALDLLLMDGRMVEILTDVAEKQCLSSDPAINALVHCARVYVLIQVGHPELLPATDLSSLKTIFSPCTAADLSQGQRATFDQTMFCIIIKVLSRASHIPDAFASILFSEEENLWLTDHWLNVATGRRRPAYSHTLCSGPSVFRLATATQVFREIRTSAVPILSDNLVTEIGKVRQMLTNTTVDWSRPPHLTYRAFLGGLPLAVHMLSHMLSHKSKPSASGLPLSPISPPSTSASAAASTAAAASAAASAAVSAAASVPRIVVPIPIYAQPREEPTPKRKYLQMPITGREYMEPTHVVRELNQLSVSDDLKATCEWFQVHAKEVRGRLLASESLLDMLRTLNGKATNDDTAKQVLLLLICEVMCYMQTCLPLPKRQEFWLSSIGTPQLLAHVKQDSTEFDALLRRVAADIEYSASCERVGYASLASSFVSFVQTTLRAL